MTARPDIDLAVVGAAIGDASRTKVLLALAEGRALAASVLAAEAGVSAATISAHLSKLLDARLVTMERHGRHRYYRLAGPDVADVLESLAKVARPAPITSLRESTRSNALRRARTCYDHLAGRLGVALMSAMLERGVLTGHDGSFRPGTAVTDRLSAPGNDIAYRLGTNGHPILAAFGVHVDDLPTRRPMIRYCVDWSEQRHHLAGALGAAVTARLIELAWLRKGSHRRVVHLTDAGRAGLRDVFGVPADWDGRSS